VKRRPRARLPAHPAARLRLQGNNQYRRVSLDAFFAAQRTRVERLLEEHVARVRARLLAEVDDDLDVVDER
jgi:hypothetical protein